MKQLLKYITVLLTLFSPLLAQPDTSIIFSEIMFYPSEQNSEFIELCNISESPININEYQIVYSTSSPDKFFAVGDSLLDPYQFAVILEGDYDFENGIYTNIIPDTSSVFKLDNNAFGRSGMANTSDRVLYLLNATGDTVDSYTYSADNPEGISDEKIYLNKFFQDNWANGKLIYGSPGFTNSVSPLKFDLSIRSLETAPEFPEAGDSIQIFVSIQNSGLDTANNFLLKVFNDVEQDSTAEESEVIFSENIGELNPGEIYQTTFLFDEVQEREYLFIAEIEFTKDQNQYNNTGYLKFIVSGNPAQLNDLIINEVMYSPQEDEPEWIEIFNRSGKEINVNSWTLNDKTGIEKLTAEDFFLQPNEFLILSDDENIENFYDIESPVLILNLPSLNNSGDLLVLKNGTGKVVDSLSYEPGWGGAKGISLERIDPNVTGIFAANWGSSTFGATPGFENSLTPADYDLQIKNFSAENYFIIIPERIEFEIKAVNKGRNNATDFTMNLFNDINRDSIPQPAELIESENIGFLRSKDSLKFNYSYTNYNAGLNNFIAKINFEPEEKDFDNIAFTKIKAIETNEERNDLVINEFMSSPFQDDAEWIEIFNRSDKIINLKNYQIADQNDTSLIIANEVSLSPGEYFVIAKDSSVTIKYDIDSNLIISGFPTLNNSGDKIILLDSLNRIIDSLEYNSDWELRQGFSNEKINSDGSTEDFSNWQLTKNKIGGTPGFINSTTPKDFDISVDNIFFSPPNPSKGDNVRISVFVKNIGIKNISFQLSLYRYNENDEKPDALLEESQLLNLVTGDSLIYTFNFRIISLSNTETFMVAADAENDKDTTNNHFQKSITPGIKPFSIVINEIKFLPEDEEPEWIELFNRSSEIINLNNWRLVDVLSSPDSIKISGEDLFLGPNDYMVLSSDSLIYKYYSEIPSKVITLNIPTLNNSSDGIVLKDSFGHTIDSVFYIGSWSRKGFSLERISTEVLSLDSLNWTPTTANEKGTPGRINSAVPKRYDLSLDSIYTEPEFAETNDSVKIISIIKNSGTLDAEIFTIRYSLDDNTFEEKSFSLLKSGDSSHVKSTNFFRLSDSVKISAEIIYDKDENKSDNYLELKKYSGLGTGAVLINEIMYSPKPGNPEWIELVNVSGNNINLKNWFLGDLMPEKNLKIITNENAFLKPAEIFIVSGEEMIEKDSELKIFHSDFSLSNTEDAIAIYDFRGALIDSVKYNADWGGGKGVSLERVSISVTLNNSLNWHSSLDETGSTPGLENSFRDVSEYAYNSIIFNEIMFDPDASNSEFIELYNVSGNSVNIGGWTVEDESGKIVKVSRTNKILNDREYFIVASDSLILNNYAFKNLEKLNCENSGMSLSKNEEKIFLKDLFGNVIDSIGYKDTWHNANIFTTKNKSLERISHAIGTNVSSNWSTSVDLFGATPLKKNSIFTPSNVAETQLSFSPNPFSPDDDGVEDFTIINYKLKNASSQIRIRIFDSRGRCVRTLADNLSAASEGSLIFDGLDDDKNPLRIGIYIVFLEALDNFSGVIQTLKEVVVIARRL